MKIVPYSPEYKEEFIEMNKAWISGMFRMEPQDEKELANIENKTQNLIQFNDCPLRGVA